MTHYCGIDFGTTNSVISLIPAQAGLKEDSLLEPTVLYFPPDKESAKTRHVGAGAIETYLAQGMRGRFFQSFKSLLPDPDFLHTRINGKLFKPEDLVAAVLRHLKQTMETKHETEISSLVLGRPARFSTLQERDALAQTRLEQAAFQAGFTEVHFELEPIAAAWAYERTLQKEELVLVGDFGGGTSDFTVMRLNPQYSHQGAKARDRTQDILASSGVYIGGDAFDAAIMKSELLEFFGAKATYESFGRRHPVPIHLFNTICHWERIHFLKTLSYREEIRSMLPGSSDRKALERLIALIERDLAYGLSKSVQRSKHQISDDESSQLLYEVPWFTINQVLTRTSFEASIQGLIRGIDDCVQEALQQAQVTEADISAVFLTGGSSKVPMVRSIFHGRFSPEKVHIDSDQFMSVASGLALKARALHGA